MSAALARLRFGIAVESAAPDGIPRKDAGELAPLFGVLVVCQAEYAGGGGVVAGLGADAAVIDGQLAEIGQDGKGQLGRPGIAAELVGGRGVGDDIDGGFLGLDKELALGPDAKGVIGGLDATALAQAGLVNDVAVAGRAALAVVDVPAQRGKQRVDELGADLSLVIGRAAVEVGVLLVAGDEIANGFERIGHGFGSPW